MQRVISKKNWAINLGALTPLEASLMLGQHPKHLLKSNGISSFQLTLPNDVLIQLLEKHFINYYMWQVSIIFSINSTKVFLHSLQ